MRKHILPLLLFLVCLVWVRPAAAQNECSFTFTATGDATQTGVSNLSGGTPCANWRVTYSVTGTLATTVTFQTSPDNTSFTSVPNTVCSSTVQPPCIFQGTNPLTGTTQGNTLFAAYGSWVRVTTSSSSGTGTVTVRGYGAKGASASVSNGIGGGSGGAGTVTSVTITGTANQLGVSGTCSGTTIINCNLHFLNSSVVLDSSGNFQTPGQIVTGVGSGTSGKITFNGSGSGSAALQAAAAQGSPAPIQFPTTTGAALSFLQTDGNNPQQTIWIPAQGTDAKVLTAGTVAGLAATLCTDANGGATTTGCSGGGGGGSAGSTLFSTTASTAVTAASATTLIGTVTGSTTIPANTFTAGSVTEIMGQGFYTTPLAARTLTINLNIGGSTRITTGAVTVLPSVTNGVWRLRCVVTTRTAGSSGTQIANCIFETAPSSLSVLTPAAASMQSSSTWTVDTTGTIAIDLQAAWDSTTGAPSITATNVGAWIPGAPVTSVFGQTGAVDIPITTTDISTPGNPAAGKTKSYSKGGAWCSLNPSGTETCTGGSGGSTTVTPPYLSPDGVNFFGPVYATTKPPSTAALTFVNQGGASTTTENGAFLLNIPNNSGDSIRYLHTASYPATPFTFTVGMILNSMNGVGSAAAGIMVSDGTKFQAWSVLTQSAAQLTFPFKATSATNISSVGTTKNLSSANVPVWLTLVDDGVNFTAYISYDPFDLQSLQIEQVARTSFLTATQIGIFGNSNATGPISALFFHWTGI
jgi:hypothetical protein